MADHDERQIGDLTVRIDRESCISSGNCIKVAPGLFDLDEESIVVFASGAADEPADRVVEACRVCPVEALRVRGASGEEIVP
jgi:ferredoxin